MLPMFINAAIVLSPVIVCLVAFERVDAFKLVSFAEILALLALGGAAAGGSYLANNSVMDTFPLGLGTFQQVGAPVVEEVLKALLIVLVFALNRVGYMIDAAIVGFAVGAGFAIVENILYLNQFAGASTGIWLVRGFGTAIMHGGAAALFSVIAQLLYAPRLRADASRFRFNPLLFVPGLLAAIALHAAFNRFTNAPLEAMAVVLVAVPLTLVTIFVVGETHTHRWLAQSKAAHAHLLADIESGAFADSAHGRAIAALASRLGAALGAALNEYIHLYAELVVLADADLLAIEAHEVTAHKDRVRAKLHRLHDLEKMLGHAAVMSVRQHLHFSRNDLWKMHELEMHTARG